jgi:hypothetical protein
MEPNVSGINLSYLLLYVGEGGGRRGQVQIYFNIKFILPVIPK